MNMVIDSASGLLTVLGAAISGVIGVGYSEYRSKREEHKELKRWYSDAIRLTERIDRLRNQTTEPDDQVYVRNTCSGVLGRLKDLIMRAPVGVEESVLIEAEDFARECQKIVQIEEDHLKSNPGVLDEIYEPVLHQARKLKKSAEIERSEVGWF